MNLFESKQYNPLTFAGAMLRSFIIPQSQKAFCCNSDVTQDVEYPMPTHWMFPLQKSLHTTVVLLSHKGVLQYFA